MPEIEPMQLPQAPPVYKLDVRLHWDQVDELVDWLVAKHRAGYKMTNSTSRISEMKQFMRGGLQDWNCRAGQNPLIIRTDELSLPAFPCTAPPSTGGRSSARNSKWDPEGNEDVLSAATRLPARYETGATNEVLLVMI